jgi:hypothetical protein
MLQTRFFKTPQVFELDTPTIAKAMPRKNDAAHGNGFSATNTSQAKESSPTLTEHPNAFGLRHSYGSTSARLVALLAPPKL